MHIREVDIAQRSFVLHLGNEAHAAVTIEGIVYVAYTVSASIVVPLEALCGIGFRCSVIV